MPFYPTPDRDDGYDITDFYGVDPRLGNHGDFVELVRTARDRGMRVIVDLVVNHTSDQHPWFRSARSSRTLALPRLVRVERRPAEDQEERHHVPRPGDQPLGVGRAGRPALPAPLLQAPAGPQRGQPGGARRDRQGHGLLARSSACRASGWTRCRSSSRCCPSAGVDLPDPHAYLRELRAFLDRRTGDAILLGEVNLPHADQRRFIGDEDGDELTMLFDFIGMQNLYLALARADARPLVEALLARPPFPQHAQWATFVRNHDELTLDKLTDAERQEVFDAFGPDPDMQIYGRGLRRRLPPMLDGDPRRIRMVYSLLFSLPGTPVLFYGEEIGMGEELSAEGRHAVRTTMQWTDGRNGGFSDAPPSRLVAPTVQGGFGPEHVNVAAQRRDPDSLLRFMTLLVQRYREAPELGWGELHGARPAPSLRCWPTW